jgi:hypothetical protein
LEPALGEGGELAHVAAWANRNPGRLARIAGLLHLAQGRGPDDLISLDTMERASRIMRFFQEVGRQVLEQPDASTRKALRVLAGWEKDTITVRDLHRTVFNAKGPAQPAKQLAGELVERGVLEPISQEAGRPGRPPEAYLIVRDSL